MATVGGRWISQSVAKSVTSTLVGVAMKDGFIASLDDPVTKYIPGLRDSAYDGVTIRQVLTMTLGEMERVTTPTRRLTSLDSMWIRSSRG
ncbi:MAG: beta-lactamase family protein [Acidobacteria bacterium]|nr:beta-lactamase family protein [Acidobacteriota bacterium]